VIYNGRAPRGSWPPQKRRMMTSQISKQITQLLAGWERGDPDALNELTPVVYNELHRIAHRYMRRERPGHTLQTSDLINEAYIRLIDQRAAHWRNRAHFFAIAAKQMRRILVDRARARGYAKRGANPLQVSLDEGMAVSGKKSPDMVALDDALKELEAMDARKSRIVEMRFFGGLSLEETAEALGISVPTVEREWRSARAWLHKAMTTGHSHES
jgi:RNA polymerase sigma factor (TIGR02999 family)